MIYPDASIDKWTKKYGLQVYTVKCKVCATPNSQDKLFACHSCNSPLRLYSSVPRTEEATKEWNEIMSGFDLD
jgi:transcription initiation factor IIE alpha subunit